MSNTSNKQQKININIGVIGKALVLINFTVLLVWLLTVFHTTFWPHTIQECDGSTTQVKRSVVSSLLVILIIVVLFFQSRFILSRKLHSWKLAVAIVGLVLFSLIGYVVGMALYALAGGGDSWCW